MNVNPLMRHVESEMQKIGEEPGKRVGRKGGYGEAEYLRLPYLLPSMRFSTRGLTLI